MFERIIAVADGRAVLDGPRSAVVEVSPTHLQWIESLLSESPASLHDIPLGSSPDGDLSIEWQAVFQGSGVAYIRSGGRTIATSLLLHGRFPVSEQAAIEAVQQTVQSARTRSSGFDLIRKHRGRPLRAVLLSEDGPKPETLALVEYWTDCLALAYFGLQDSTIPDVDRPVDSHPEHAASAV